MKTCTGKKSQATTSITYYDSSSWTDSPGDARPHRGDGDHLTCSSRLLLVFCLDGTVAFNLEISTGNSFRFQPLACSVWRWVFSLQPRADFPSCVTPTVPRTLAFRPDSYHQQLIGLSVPGSPPHRPFLPLIWHSSTQSLVIHAVTQPGCAAVVIHTVIHPCRATVATVAVNLPSGWDTGPVFRAATQRPVNRSCCALSPLHTL